MKLGMLTFHSAYNYGAVIQCYALQKYFESLGHDVYVIDYRPSYIQRFYKCKGKQYWQGISFVKTFLNLLLELIRIPIRIKRKNAFESFISSHLRLYPFFPNDDFSTFNYIIIGSDQVWNANITDGHFDPLFFGIGIKCKTIAYAASNRSQFLSEKEMAFYKSNLSNFHSISVRESILQDLLQPLTRQKVLHVLDPTLLAGDILLNNLHLKRKVDNKYVLIYEINPHEDLYSLAKFCAKNHSCKLLEIYSRVYARHLRDRIQTASPEDWVSYIKYAEFVFTTSFHGVCLSIILKKEFYYIRQNSDADGRIISLLSLLALENRIIDTKILDDSRIDYVAVNKVLAAKRKESADFLSLSIYT